MWKRITSLEFCELSRIRIFRVRVSPHHLFFSPSFCSFKHKMTTCSREHRADTELLFLSLVILYHHTTSSSTTDHHPHDDGSFTAPVHPPPPPPVSCLSLFYISFSVCVVLGSHHFFSFSSSLLLSTYISRLNHSIVSSPDSIHRLLPLRLPTVT